MSVLCIVGSCTDLSRVLKRAYPQVGWGAGRQFAVDMAGFAINLRFLLARPAAQFAQEVKIGHQVIIPLDR